MSRRISYSSSSSSSEIELADSQALTNTITSSSPESHNYSIKHLFQYCKSPGNYMKEQGLSHLQGDEYQTETKLEENVLNNYYSEYEEDLTNNNNQESLDNTTTQMCGGSSPDIYAENNYQPTNTFLSMYSKVDLELPHPKTSLTPLHYAAYFGMYIYIYIYNMPLGNVEVVRDLVNAGVNVETKSNMGRRAIHYSIINGSLQCVRELIHRGQADINAITDSYDSSKT